MLKGRNIKEGELPRNPRWVVIEASDGDMRRWPVNTSPNPDAEGCINYMKPVPLDNGMAIKWRITVGQRLAEMFKYDNLEKKNWVLKAWPAGYQFYDHHKGREDGPIRHDLYLLGSENVARFRSPQEFIPHAYWLMTDKTLNRMNCACKYCARKPQREISDALGISQWSGPSSQARVPIAQPRNNEYSPRRRATGRNQPVEVFATVRHQPKPVRLPKGPKQFVLPECENDLRAALCPKSLGQQRWARTSELVWVKLDYPIALDEMTGTEEVITFWPGFIEDKVFKADIQPKEMKGNETSADHATPKGSDEDIEVPWTISHKWFYKIKLLVVAKTVLYGDDHILPYQSHAPSTKLLCAIESVYVDVDNEPSIDKGGIILPPTSEESLEEDNGTHLLKLFEKFNPFPEHAPQFRNDDERRTYFTQASGPFVTAIQIASRLAQFWTPTDEWENKMTTPVSSRYGAGTNVPETHLEPQDMEDLNQRVNSASSTARVPITQMCFQGLWWGPERIWMGDLVRLKLARYQLAPKGNAELKKVSGAGKSAKEEIMEDLGVTSASLTKGSNVARDSDTVMREHDREANSTNIVIQNGDDTVEQRYNGLGYMGASSRSLFLRVESLFVAYAPRGNGSVAKPECRVSGMLYELADEDWEEDELDGPSNKRSTVRQANIISSTSRTPAVGPSTSYSSRGAMSLAEAFNLASKGSAPQSTPAEPLFTPNPDLLSELPMDKSNMNVTLPTAPESISASELGPQPSSDTETVPMFVPSPNTTTAISHPGADAFRFAVRSETKVHPLAGPFKQPASSSSHPHFRQQHPLPPPPRHCRFRPILRPTHEAVFPLVMLAGRYYPNLLMNPLLRDRVEAVARAPNSRRSDALWALEGHMAGLHNSIDPLQFIPSRARMVQEAEKIAWVELLRYWRSQAAAETRSWTEPVPSGETGVIEDTGTLESADAMDISTVEPHVASLDDVIIPDDG